MRTLGLQRLPVLGRLAAGPAGRRGRQPGRPRLLRPARRRAARPGHRRPGRRSTTGTCRRRWRTPAAGRSATPPSASPSTPRSSPRRSATGSALDHAERAVVLGVPRLRAAAARARPSRAGRRGRGRPPPAARATASRSQALRAAVPDAAGRHHAEPLPRRPRSTTRAATRRRAADRRPAEPSSSTRCSGSYPDDVLRTWRRPTAAFVRDGDLATDRAPLDFLGVNYYTRHVVGAGPVPGQRRRCEFHLDRPALTTAMGWEIDPDGLRDLLIRLQRDYPAIPLYVTENGAAYDDVSRPTARCTTPTASPTSSRTSRAARRAIEQGVPLRGYFVWSLLDNFEWAYGYAQRFGLVHVDYATQLRTPKDSARWYARPSSGARHASARVLRSRDLPRERRAEPADPRAGGGPCRRRPRHRLPGRQRVVAGGERTGRAVSRPSRSSGTCRTSRPGRS